MIVLPDFNRAFDYENGFYLSCDTSRIGKLIAQYELFRMSVNIPGEIVECGVFKGVSFVRFAHFREIFGLSDSKRITGFDTFDEFPDPTYAPDKELLDRFLADAGNMSISKDQLTEILNNKKLDKNIALVEGDVSITIPEYVKSNKRLSISFLNLDVDLYEPSRVILENLYPLLSSGGILLLDDYGKFPGETRAVDEYFSEKEVEIRQFPYAKSPSYIIKK
jgi:predicted O-methyltransferase YrrM